MWPATFITAPLPFSAPLRSELQLCCPISGHGDKGKPEVPQSLLTGGKSLTRSSPQACTQTCAKRKGDNVFYLFKFLNAV